MNRSVASTGWWPSQPPRTTRAVLVSVMGCFLLVYPLWSSGGVAGAGFDGRQDLLHLQGIGERRLGLAVRRMAVTRSTTWCVKPCS